MSSTMNLMRDDLKNFNAYSSARTEANEGRIWLNANELPWNSNLNRYPSQQPDMLTTLLAKNYEVDDTQILITRGSDEGIDLLIRLFCQFNRDSILICPPTFGMYEIGARLQGARIIKCPLNTPDFDFDLKQVLSTWNPQIKLIFLCSPNNPTGNLIDPNAIVALCKNLQGKSIIVVDEAYVEFANTPSLARYINTLDNLVVLRTLSKAFALAAARVGSLLTNPELISWLKKILPPYPIPSLSTNAATEAFCSENIKIRKKRISEIIQARENIATELKKMRIVEYVWPSKGNYLLVKFTQPIYALCQNQGIVLREMSARTGIANAIRITIGTADENDALIKFLRTL